MQARGEVHIKYEIIGESGPDHDKSFIAQVKVNGKVLAKGKRKIKEKCRDGSSSEMRLKIITYRRKK